MTSTLTNRRMLFIQPGLKPGAGSSITSFAIQKHLAKKNSVAYFPFHPSDRGMLAELQAENVQVIGNNRPMGLGKLARLIGSMLRWRPEFVYSFGVNANLIGLLLAKMVGGRIIVSYRGTLDGLPAFKRILTPFINRYADAIIAISFAIKHQLVHLYGASEVKIAVIPPPIECPNFTHYKEKENCRNIYFVGRLHRDKGIDMLLAAMKMLPLEQKLQIVGDGPERGSLEEMVKSLCLQERVEFLGYRPDVVNLLYESAELLVVPSRREGLGRVILEAFAAGVPVIATGTGGILELVQDGATGYLIDYPPSPEKIGNAILRALGDRANWTKIREKALEVVDGYREDRVLHQNEELFWSLLAINQGKG